jgi:hypothetical protein
MKANDGFETLPKEFIDSTIIKIFREMSYSKDNSRLMVLITHGFIELLVNTLIESKCKNSKRLISNRRDYPHSSKLLLLNELSIISDDQYRLLVWFKNLRNRAAHEPIFEITNQDLQRFKEAKDRDPNNFFMLCIAILSNLWNQHVKVFSPIFAPKIFGVKIAEKIPPHCEEVTLLNKRSREYSQSDGFAKLTPSLLFLCIFGIVFRK